MSNAYAAVSALIFTIVAVIAPRENNQPMVSRDWAEQHIHECIVDSLCRALLAGWGFAQLG